MNSIVLTLMYIAVTVCQDQERHLSFHRFPYYGYYQPPPPPPRNLYAHENCCQSQEFKAAGCQLRSGTSRYTGLPLTLCKCCVGVDTYQQLYSMASSCATSTVTAATTATTTVAPTTVAATTTTTTPTTTAQQKFCPNSGCARRKRGTYDFFKTLRIAGGTSVTSTCDYPGVVAIQATAPNGDALTVCTGALISETEVQLPSNCAETLNLAGATNDVAVVDGNEIVIASISSSKPLAIATLSTPVDINAAPSQACIYNKNMGAYNNCEIVGYGTDTTNQLQTVAQTSKVTFNDIACNGIDTSLTIPEASYGCASLEPNSAACAGDGGALIVCDLLSTQEKVVVGQAETFDCDTNNPAVYFQNFDV
ncbi:uncharacterized protein LOC126816715 [Patella vulgata]|uniref:uncharacterized protein LOC126816715 n=1 Tax=Patella vulgata TaxID=6465 RepID=UPI0021808342|nr:uncharacterized protein LOC126816715 [Patella vulgata]